MSLTQLIIILLIYFVVIRPIVRSLRTGSRYGSSNAQNDPYTEATFLRVIFIVASKVAHADGTDHPHERQMVVEMVRKVFGNPNLDAETILRQYEEHKNMELHHNDVSVLSLRYRQIVFNCAINVAISDHVVTEGELRALEGIGKALELPQLVIDTILNELRQVTGGQGQRSYKDQEISATDFAYKTLGLKKGASQSEIKKAYRRLAMKHHPDRAAKNDKAVAEEKFKEIGDAYKILKRQG